MQPRLKRQFSASIAATLAAAILIAACWTLPALIPTSWHSAGKAATSNTYEPYADPQGRLIYLIADVTLIPIGQPLETQTRLIVTLTDKLQSVPAESGVTSNRDEAYTELHDEFQRFCSLTAYPQAADLFSAAIADPQHTVVITYPERARVALLLSLTAYILPAAWLLLALSSPLSVYFLN
jgi:hypothetical protein